MTTLAEPRNFFIKNVQLNWARLDKPVSPFGTEQYELQVATTDKKYAAELKANHFNVKEKDGVYTVALKRKARKANGEDNGAPKVLNADLSPFSFDEHLIGNGSVGNVKVYQYPYDVMGRKGVGSSLTAVQIVDLVAYTGGSANDGFEAIDMGDDSPKAADDSDDLF